MGILAALSLSLALELHLLAADEDDKTSNHKNTPKPVNSAILNTVTKGEIQSVIQEDELGDISHPKTVKLR